MTNNKGNIEEFLRKRMEGLENELQGDWSAFEKKLDRAIYFRRVRRASFVGTLTVLMGLVYFGGNYFQYRSAGSDVANEEMMPNVEQVITEDSGIEEVSVGSVVTTTNDIVDQPVASSHTETKQINDLPSETEETTSSISSGVSEALNSVFPALASAASDVEASEEEATLLALADENESSDEQQDFIRDFGNETPLKLGWKSFLDNSDLEMKKGSSGQTHLDLGSMSGIDVGSTFIAVRSPISPVKIKKQKTGPYISPLQESSPWSYSLNVYPNFTFRKFKVDEDKRNLLHRDFIDAVEVSEKGGFSLNVGLEISRRIGAIVYLNTGVEYISYNTNARFNFSHFREANINGVTGEIESYTLKGEPEQITFSDNNAYHYLNFPLSISYKPWASDHIRLNIETGASLLYFMSASGKSLNYKTLDIIDLSERDYNKYIASFSVKVGANYFVSPKINLAFEPTLVYFTNTIYSEDYPFYVIPYSVGLNLKLQVKLN